MDKYIFLLKGKDSLNKTEIAIVKDMDKAKHIREIDIETFEDNIEKLYEKSEYEHVVIIKNEIIAYTVNAAYVIGRYNGERVDDDRYNCPSTIYVLDNDELSTIMLGEFIDDVEYNDNKEG